MSRLPASPLFPNGTVQLIKEIPRDWLVSLWRRKCRIDPSPWLPEECSIRLMKCETSGLEFYDPPSLAAPPEFYALLQRTGGSYYPDTKWEFDRAAASVPSGARVLDVGCGDGAFLRLIRDEKACVVRGLETNREGRRAAEMLGLEVLDQLASDHRAAGKGPYDVVTAFQVLEHLVDPLGFLLDLKSLVRPGGLVIIAVPNARSFLDWVSNPLDMPPHHMTRWDAGVFSRLPTEGALAVRAAEEEPLQMGQRDPFLNGAFTRLRISRFVRSDTAEAMAKAVLAKALGWSFLRRRFRGQSLLVVLQRI